MAMSLIWTQLPQLEACVFRRDSYGSAVSAQWLVRSASNTVEVCTAPGLGQGPRTHKHRSAPFQLSTG